MPLPKSNLKWSKGGIEFTESIDRAQYTIRELVRAANRDVGKYVRRQMLKKAREMPGMRRSRRLYNALQYWARSRETDLIIGAKHDTWYGAEQELGSSGQPKRAIIRNSVYESIATIREIQGQYLSSIEDENKAQALIDEKEYRGEDDGENI